MPRLYTMLMLFVICSACGPLRAGEWTQFRGPDGQGHASERTRLPFEFGEDKNVTWKTAIPGKGWSSPVVLDGQVWMTTALDGGKSLRAVCVNELNGQIVHDVEVFAPEKPVFVNETNSHASPTPVIEPGRVYVHFGTMGTACLSTKTGDVLWRNENLKLDHKEGPGGSPILFENLLILNCDGMDVQYVVALDKQTGDIVWKTDRSAPLRAEPDLRKAYATPIIVTVDGLPQVVSTGADQIEGYNARTGEELWRVRYVGFSNVPLPLVGDGVVYVSTGFTKPELWAIKLGGTSDVTDSHVLWKYAKTVPAKPSPILVGDRVYMTTDKGVATCIDIKTGEPVWQKRLGGNHSASPIFVSGQILFFSEEGEIYVIEPGDKFVIRSTPRIEGHIMSTPAVADGAMFLRTETHLYRIEDPTAAAAAGG